jgi:hypothetical protein
MEGARYDLHAVTDAKAAGQSGVPHERELLALAEAMVRGGDAEMRAARAAAVDAIGPDAFVEAAAVASNFERMVRIADAAGIPLDAPLDALTARCAPISASTPSAGGGEHADDLAAASVVGRVIAPLARFIMPAMAAQSRRARQERFRANAGDAKDARED